jgi:Mechanosensitive ion channel
MLHTRGRKRRTLALGWLLWLCLVALGSRAVAEAQAPAVGSAPAEGSAPVEAAVTLRNKQVFVLARGEGGLATLERARAASRALAEAASEKNAAEARWVSRGLSAVVFVGEKEIVALSAEDASALHAGSLESLAARVTTEVQRALASERQRTSLANTVFAISLVVFFGLITLYLMGRVRAFASAARDFLVTHPGRVPALKLNRLEVLGPASVRNALIIVLGVGRVLGLLGLVYAWLVVSLSLFERTRPWVARLTGVLLDPLSALVSRVALAVPTFVIAIFAMALLAVLLRVTDLFFASVARGETRIALVPPDLAHPTSILLRAGLVVLTLLFAGPILTGDHDGSLSRGALVLLLGIALAASPLCCAVLMGLALAFSRSVRLGDRIDYGGQSGVVGEIGLVWLVLSDSDGASVRVPHLRALWYPTRIHKRGVT